MWLVLWPHFGHKTTKLTINFCAHIVHNNLWLVLWITLCPQYICGSYRTGTKRNPCTQKESMMFQMCVYRILPMAPLELNGLQWFPRLGYQSGFEFVGFINNKLVNVCLLAQIEYSLYSLFVGEFFPCACSPLNMVKKYLI